MDYYQHQARVIPSEQYVVNYSNRGTEKHGTQYPNCAPTARVLFCRQGPIDGEPLWQPEPSPRGYEHERGIERGQPTRTVVQTWRSIPEGTNPQFTSVRSVALRLPRFGGNVIWFLVLPSFCHL